MKKLPERRWTSFWRHFYDRERTVDQLTQAMIEWQRAWNWDFIKVNPAACYHVLDLGAEYEFHSDGITEPTLIRPAIAQKEDFRSVAHPDVRKGALEDQLLVLRNLRKEFGPDLPIVHTVFSPIEIAHRLMRGREELLHWKKESPLEVHALLEFIAETFIDFCNECLRAGADGIFFATKWATSDLLTWEDYQEFGKQYDLAVLDQLSSNDALIILHVCGSRTYLKNMLDYPTDIFSYDFYGEGAIDPGEVSRLTGKYVIGGIDPDRMEKDPEGAARVCEPYKSVDRWLAGPSCVVPPTVSAESIRTIKQLL